MLKFRAGKIFDGYRFISDKILITENDGTIIDLVTEESAGDDIKLLDGILCPGFINCHCHLELSHMKGLIPEKSGLVEFVTRVVQQRHVPETEILSAIEKAEDEMLNNGIIAVGDICNNTLTLAQKEKQRIRYHNFIEASGFNPTVAVQRFERSLQFYNEYISHTGIEKRSVSIVPHAPYSVADALWHLIINFPGNHLLTIHNQETPEENEWFIQKTGKFSNLYENLKIDVDFFQASGNSSLQTYLPKFLKEQSLILVHNVQTSESDLVFAKSTRIGPNLYWCFCVNANKYITGDVPDIDLFIKHKQNIVLGTDSLASNHQLSIAAEIKTILKNFPAIQPEQVLTWATSNGAAALQLDSMLGSFEKGKKPGVIIFNKDFENVRRLA
jgi:cytosine/adenosine deaminase-related metal-dependent hydrolase